MLKKANIQWNPNTLIKQIKKGNLVFDCAIQRGNVWDNERNSLLIHSMIEGYPIPAFYFMKTDSGQYSALDGKQRSNAILGFLNDEYALHENFPSVTDDNGEEYDLSLMKFSEIPEFARDEILNYSLTIYYFEQLTDEERDEMFFRLNNGKPLTAIELTRVKAKSLESFQKIAEHEVINMAVTEKGKIKYNHENLAMQAWAVLFEENPSFETKIFRPMIENADVTEEQTQTIINCLDLILKVRKNLDITAEELENEFTTKEDINKIIKANKKTAKAITTRTHLVMLIKAAERAIREGVDENEFIKWAKGFYSGKKAASVSEQYNAAASARAASAENINKRIEFMFITYYKYFDKEAENSDKWDAPQRTVTDEEECA